MRRILVLLSLVLLLLPSCSKDYGSEKVSELRIELDGLVGTRVRIMVASMNTKAYYSYVQLASQDEYYSASSEEVAKYEIGRMEDNYEYYDELDIKGSFLDVFCYQGSRQFSVRGLTPDTDFRYIFFQLHPKTHALIGEPVEVKFRTKPVPERDLTFDVQIVDNQIWIHPSDLSLTYFWQYEDNDIIEDAYFFPQEYLYELMSLYDEYGFLESELTKGPDVWNFADDKWFQPGKECTLVIAGCENGDFTTHPQQLVFRYNGPSDIEIIDPLRECGIN